LILTYQVRPLLKRLQQTFYGLTLLLAVGGLGWVSAYLMI
ncbi:MAG: CGLD27 family protein, partial [Oscillatoriales cyanobacterium RM1_1_9]|nr:CGLD27 family protein [Oscillatoriales cyanobacterium RM1_1_9]